MRRFGIGLAMAAMAVLAASAAYAKDKDTSATDLPPALAAAKAPCTMTDSRFIAEGAGKDKVNTKYYEAACKEGLGLVVAVKDKVPVPDIFDCYTMAQPGADGKPSNLICKLPANVKPIDGLQAIANTTDHACTVSNARLIGSSAERTFVELACQGGVGYILGFARHLGGEAPLEISCIDPQAKDNLACKLTDPAQQLVATTAALMSSSGKQCAIKDRRYIGATTDGLGLYEVACDNGKGYMIESTGDKLKVAVDCALATNIAGGCTLTDSRAAETAQNALYTKLAKNAGFDCAVSKYAAFDVAGGDKEVVELACSNRPDGGVGMFPIKAGKPVVYDCLRSQAEGFKCSYSKEEAIYPKLSAELKSVGRGTCVVSGARPLGKTDNTDLIEVACADGNPGWVMEFPAFGPEVPHLIPCAATSIGGGCQLPTNKKK